MRDDTTAEIGRLGTEGNGGPGATTRAGESEKTGKGKKHLFFRSISDQRNATEPI